MALPLSALAIPPPSSVSGVPCPSCRATNTVCTAKSPSPQAYWRCRACGDVWSPARVETAPRGWRA
jgi:transposase-like protein